MLISTSHDLAPLCDVKIVPAPSRIPPRDTRNPADPVKLKRGCGVKRAHRSPLFGNRARSLPRIDSHTQSHKETVGHEHSALVAPVMSMGPIMILNRPACEGARCQGDLAIPCESQIQLAPMSPPVCRTWQYVVSARARNSNDLTEAAVLGSQRQTPSTYVSGLVQHLSLFNHNIALIPLR